MEGTRYMICLIDFGDRIVSQTSQAGLIKKESCLTWLRRRERNAANGIVSKERVVCETQVMFFLFISLDRKNSLIRRII